MYLIELVIATGLFLGVFSSSIILGQLIGSRISRKIGKHIGIVTGMITQVLFTTLSFILAFTILPLKILGLTLYVERGMIICWALIPSAILVLTIIYSIINNRWLKISARESYCPTSYFSIVGLITLLLVAPFGEELLYRGLVEGYLILTGAPMVIAVFFPAILFALTHIIPFRRMFRGNMLWLMILEVFTTGTLLGFQRWMTGSLLPSVLGHSFANLGGMISYNLLHPRGRQASPNA